MSDRLVKGLGCRVCGLLVKDKDAVDHPRAGRVHKKCADLLSFKQTGGRSPGERDPSDFGRGSSEYES